MPMFLKIIPVNILSNWCCSIYWIFLSAHVDPTDQEAIHGIVQEYVNLFLDNAPEENMNDQTGTSPIDSNVIVIPRPILTSLLQSSKTTSSSIASAYRWRFQNWRVIYFDFHSIWYGTVRTDDRLLCQRLVNLWIQLYAFMTLSYAMWRYDTWKFGTVIKR